MSFASDLLKEKEKVRDERFPDGAKEAYFEIIAQVCPDVPADQVKEIHKLDTDKTAEEIARYNLLQPYVRGIPESDSEKRMAEILNKIKFYGRN